MKWSVTLEAFKEVEVEADSPEEAVEAACDEVNSWNWDGVDIIDNRIVNLDEGVTYVLKGDK